MILIPRKYAVRPNGHLEIDWSNEHTESLIAVFPLNRFGSMNNLVTGEEPLYQAGSFTDKTTTEGSFAGFNTSADYVTYDPLSNHGIVDSTPVTIAWQQSLDSNGVYLMSPFSWMPSGLTRSFAITTSATGAGGAIQYGMTIGSENGSTTTNAGFGQVISGRTVGVHEKFVVVCTEGMHTTNAKNSHWLYRNGVKINQPTVGYNLANATTVGLKVGNTIQAPAWPMIGTFGEICIWKRAKSQEEITDYNTNPYQIYKANSNKVFFFIEQSAANVTGQNASLLITSTTGSVSQAHVLSGVNCIIGETSTVGSVGIANSLQGNNCSLDLTSTTGAISQAHVLSGLSCQLLASSTSGSVSPEKYLTANGCSLSWTSTVAAITQAHILSGISCIATNSSTTGAIIIGDAPTPSLSPVYSFQVQWGTPFVFCIQSPRNDVVVNNQLN